MKKPIKLADKLSSLADMHVFPDRGSPFMRWGQILRTTPIAAKLLEDAKRGGFLVPLKDLARVRSGVVTRANAFFIVKELPLSEIPNRFRVTRRDLKTLAVIVDGKDTPHRILKKHLRKVIKGPDSLQGPSSIQESDLRLVAVEESQNDLRKNRDNDTLAYLRRGETVSYSVSEDKMKGGIPAERANIKNRKPFWYSLHAPVPKEGQLVVPEHFDQRFIATELSKELRDRVVIDTCYLIECKNPLHQRLVLCALNSLLSWYQIELRGRTQHGEGVLKVKIPDFEGLFVPDPGRVSTAKIDNLLKAFEPLAERNNLVVSEELEQSDRAEFDSIYLETIGISPKHSENVRLTLARELREAMAERRTRPESVAELKTQSRPKQRATQIVESLAAAIVSKLRPYPDVRHYVPQGTSIHEILIPDFAGILTVGSGLFEAGTVFAGSEALAVVDSNEEARFIRAVLTADPQLRVIDLPTEGIKGVIDIWAAEVSIWLAEFYAIFLATSDQLTDRRLSEAVKLRAFELARASELR